MTQEQGADGKAHRHTAREILACPAHSPLRRDVEVCACGAQRLVDVPGKPAGQWTEMTPIPYANPIGHICRDNGVDYDFRLLGTEGQHHLRVGAKVTVLRYSPEAGAVARIRGVITRAGTPNRKGPTEAGFTVIGSQPGQGSPLRPGDPVYLEPEGASWPGTAPRLSQEQAPDRATPPRWPEEG